MRYIYLYDDTHTHTKHANMNIPIVEPTIARIVDAFGQNQLSDLCSR